MAPTRRSKLPCRPAAAANGIANKRRPLDRSSRTRLGFTTCTAMSGSGLRIAGTTTTTVLLRTDQHGSDATIQATLSSAADPGGTILRPSAPGATPASGSTLSASGWPERYAEKVQKDYIRYVKNFTAFLGRSPETATSEELRLFQLHMTRNHVSPASINRAIVALRLFFKVTLERDDLVRRLTFVREPRKAPIVLSPEEVGRDFWMPPPSASPMAQPARVRGRRAEGVRH
jgi:hypothetical protein